MRVFRETLTFLAAILAVALIAVMVAPYWLDWNQYRGQIATWMSQQLGTEVRIAGELRLKLLPTPEFDAEDVSVGPADRPAFKAARLTFTLSPVALASSSIRVIEAEAEKPVIVLEALGELAGRQPSAALGPQTGIERLVLRRATILSERSAAGTSQPVLAGVDINIEAPVLEGPFRIDIVEPASGRDFRGQVGKVEAGQARFKGVVEDKQIGLRAQVDGVLGLSGEDGRPLFDGSLHLSGAPQIGTAERGFQLAFDGTTRIIAGAERIVADPVNLTIGSGEKAVQLSGQGFVDLAGERPVVRSQLLAKRLDLGGVLGRDASPDMLLGLLRGAGGAQATLPFDLDLSLALGTVQFAGIAAQDFDLRLLADGAGTVIDRAGLRLPGATRLAFQRRERQPAPVLIDGEAEFESGEPQAFIAWLRGAEPPQALPPTLKLAADITSEADGIAINGVVIASEAGALTGKGRIDLPVTAKRAAPRLAIELAAPRLDARLIAALDPLRPMQGLEVATKLAVRALIVDGAEVGGLDVSLDRDGSVASLRQLKLKGRQGEEFTLSGSASSETIQLTAKLDAEKLDDLARIGTALLPGALAEGVLRRAAVLSPALAVANIRIDLGAGEVHWDVALDGKLGGTTLAAKSRSTAKNNELEVNIESEISNPDGARLIGQITGGKVEPLPGQPGRLRLRAEGNPRRAIAGALSGNVAGIEIASSGNLNLFRLQSPFEGRIRLETADLSHLHKALGGGAPHIAPGLPARVEGRLIGERAKLTLTGFAASFGAERASGEISFDLARSTPVAGQIKLSAVSLATLLGPAIGPLNFDPGNLQWPREAFREPLPPLLAGDLWIEGERFHAAPGLVLESPRFVLRFAPDIVSIEGFEAKAGEAAIAATLALSRREAQVDLAGRIALTRVRFPGLAGIISGDMPVTASGANPFELISSLGGAGRASIAGLVVPESDPTALARIVARPLDDFGAIDEIGVGRVVDEELRRGELALPALAVSASLVNGQLRLSAAGGEAANPRGVSLQPSLVLDLPRGFLDARVGMRLPGIPKGWRGAAPEIAVSWQGRLADPAGRSGVRRQVQVASLVNGLLAMAIQRDLERAEAFEADVRERAWFIRRQKADAFALRRHGEITAYEKKQREEAEIADAETRRREARALAEAQVRAVEEARRRAVAEAKSREEAAIAESEGQRRLERARAETRRRDLEQQRAEAEQARLRAEAERKALEERQAAERKAIEEQRAAERRQLEEQERLRREAEQALQRAEAERRRLMDLLEAERLRAAAEEQRRIEEARRAEELRQKAEAERRQRAIEEARRAEEVRLAAERAIQEAKLREEAERRRLDEEFQAERRRIEAEQAALKAEAERRRLAERREAEQRRQEELDTASRLRAIMLGSEPKAAPNVGQPMNITPGAPLDIAPRGPSLPPQ